MSGRRVATLVIAALLVIAGALFLSAQRELPRASVGGSPMLPGLLAQVEQIQEVRLARGGGTATLRRGADGWTVVERAYPADVGRIRKLLLDLADLSLVEEKTHSPANYAALGVEDPQSAGAAGTLVELHGAPAARALIVGKPATNASYVRLAGQAASALARPQITADASPASWLDKRLLDLAAERVQLLARVKPGGKTAAANEPGLAAQLAGLTFDDVRAATPVIAAETLTVTTRDGLVVELAGKHDGERRYLTLAARSAPDAKPEVVTEATRLGARGASREFELPVYRYEALFPPAPAAPQKPARVK